MAGVSQGRGRSVAGIAIDGGRFFVALRKAGGSLGEKWEFPGGKVDGDESDEEALKREFLEEFGVKVRVGPRLAGTEFSNKGKSYSLNAYRISFETMDFKMVMHTDWRWATPDEIENDGIAGGRGFADSDLGLFPALREHIITV